MAQIDQYKHKVLGFIKCASTFDFVYQSPTRDIAIYQILESSDKEDFDAKEGDIIAGGGRGEAPALRISNPQCFLHFAEEGYDDFDNKDQLYKAFWTPTDSFILCEGFLKSGWTQDVNIEVWLAQFICAALIINDQEFAKFGSIDLPVGCELTYSPGHK